MSRCSRGAHAVRAAAAVRAPRKGSRGCPSTRPTSQGRRPNAADRHACLDPSVLQTARDYLSAGALEGAALGDATGLLLSYTRAGFLETATTGAAATGPRGAMTTTTRRTRKRRTRRKVGPTPDQQPRRSHPAVDVSGPTAERAGRLSGLWRSAGRWRSAVGPSRARRRRLYRKRWARSRGRPAARATTPGSPSPASLDNSRRRPVH